MRDINRIERITTLIGYLWVRNQDMRFGQLLINYGVIPDSKVWFVEDELIEKHLEKVLKALEKENKKAKAKKNASTNNRKPKPKQRKK